MTIDNHYILRVGNGENFKNGSTRHLWAVNERIVGPLVSITPSNEELNWTGSEGGSCNIEIHYTNLYNLTALNLYTGQKGQCVVVNYENIKTKLLVDLIGEYEKIVCYSQITNTM